MARFMVLLCIGLVSVPSAAYAQQFKINELERKVRDLDRMLRDAVRQRDEARRERDVAQREKDRVQRDFESKLKAVPMQPDSLKRDNDALSSKLRQATLQVDNLKRDAVGLKQDKERLQRDRDAERENARREKGRADNLQQQLDGLRKSFQAREWKGLKKMVFEQDGKPRHLQLDQDQQLRFSIPLGFRYINVNVNAANGVLSVRLQKE